MMLEMELVLSLLIFQLVVEKGFQYHCYILGRGRAHGNLEKAKDKSNPSTMAYYQKVPRGPILKRTIIQMYKDDVFSIAFVES
jgi:hypothetical protein